MKKVTIIIPHYLSNEWAAISVHNFKKYGFSIEHEIVVVNNSPDSPSIKSISETSLAEGIRIIEGKSIFPSHAYAYKLAYDQCDSDAIFTSESDAFPTRHGWSEDFIKASVDFDLIGPEMPMASGTFIHPAGSLVKRKVLDAHKAWQSTISDWRFAPGAAPVLGLSDRGYHVVAHKDWLAQQNMSDSLKADVELWSDVGNWQEMRSFDDDSFETYGGRNFIQNWLPYDDVQHHLRIGYEPGQNLSYFAQDPRHGFKVLRAPTNIVWMVGLEGRQAAFSTVFGGFTHVWCGASSMLPAISSEVREFKNDQKEQFCLDLPDDVKKKILELNVTSAMP